MSSDPFGSSAKRRRECPGEAPDDGDCRRSKRLRGSTVNYNEMHRLKEMLEVFEARLSNKKAPRVSKGKSASASIMKTMDEGEDVGGINLPRSPPRPAPQW